MRGCGQQDKKMYRQKTPRPRFSVYVRASGSSREAQLIADRQLRSKSFSNASTAVAFEALGSSRKRRKSKHPVKSNACERSYASVKCLHFDVA